MKTVTILAAIAAAGLSAASGVGHAAHAQPVGSRTVAVHYGDLDLGSTPGRRALDHRIRQAIRSACGEASPTDLAGQNAVSQCRTDLAASLTAERDAAFASVGSRPPTLLASRR